MTSDPDHKPLLFYNSLGRALEPFEPLSGPDVGIYSCGPTVYAFPHLGNMRPYVFADTLRRTLRWRGYRVRQVVNITDVGHAVAETELGEDKLEVAAERERRSVAELADLYTRAFHADVAALNILPADEYPRASAYVDEMIAFARTLEERGYTYTIPSGLYFDTGRSPDYGALALIDAEGQREGARVEHVEGRRNKTDFALWRAEAHGKPRVMRWDSPWGWGAPGWHLECSVMSISLLGRHFDIHTGGVDHRELHHVNEIAQSEAYLDEDQPWVRYWLHNEFVQLDARRMAKSAGGTRRLADLQDAGYHPMAYRQLLVSSHYRSQIDFTLDALDAAEATLRRLLARIAPLRPLPAIEARAEALALLDPGDERGRRALDELDAAIAHDLNTPRALAVLQDGLRDAALTDAARRALSAAADALLGLRFAELSPEDLDHGPTSGEMDAETRASIERLVAERAAARRARDYARADRLRDQLAELGAEVTDTADGPVWTLR